MTKVNNLRYLFIEKHFIKENRQAIQKAVKSGGRVEIEHEVRASK